MQLTPEQINEFMAKAVLDSQLGDAVKAAASRVMKDLSATYNNPFDEVIKRHVVQMIDAEVVTTYKPLLEAGIKDAMARHMTDEVVEKIITAAMERLRSRY